MFGSIRFNTTDTERGVYAEFISVFCFVCSIGGLPGPDGLCLWHVQPGGSFVEHVCGGRVV